MEDIGTNKMFGFGMWGVTNKQRQINVFQSIVNSTFIKSNLLLRIDLIHLETGMRVLVRT